MYGARIEGVGLARPAERRPIERGAGPDVSRLTGIRERRVCAPGEDSLRLAVTAGERCLRAAKVDPDAIDALIFAGITRFTDGLNHTRLEPSLAQTVAQALGCTGAAFDLTNACAGVMTAVSMADLMIGCGDANRVLIVTGEYLSHVGENARGRVDRWDHPELASLTLGDAGGALLLSASERPGWVGASFKTLPEHAELCVAGPELRSAGGVMYTDAAAIHLHAIRQAPAVMESALAQAGLRFGEVDLVIPHQTSLRAIRGGRRHFAQHFREDARDWVVALSEHGNTGTCTHLVALGEAIARDACPPGSHVMFLVFASGLTVGCVIYRVTTEIALGPAP